MGTILEVKDLHVRYGSISAVKGISFHVDEGEIVTIIGANGAGKSSTLNCISGIIPYKGDVLLEGKSISSLPPNEIVKLGVVQVPEGRQVFNEFSVLENLQMGAYIYKGPIQDDLEKVYSIFPILRERSSQKAGALSGGEQQMLALGRALMTKPKVLLLDEPSMGLAPVIVNEVFRVIRQINAEGVTIILIEQNAKLALQTSSRAYVLETGEIKMSGNSKDLMNDKRMIDLYLGG